MRTQQRIPVGRILLTALLLGGLGKGAPVQGQSRTGTSAAPFLILGTGARGSALGHAYTAVTSGADALFWNPAGAARSYDAENRGAVFFTHTRWLAGIDYNAFGLVVPVTASGVVGLSLAQLDYGRMEVRTVELPEGTGETFGATDFVIGLSYAQPLTNTFFLGGTAKYVRQQIYDMSARTLAVDVGFVLTTGYLNGLRLAASIMNFGGEMQMRGVNTRVFVDIDPTNDGSNDALPAQLETQRWELPLSFKFGTAWPVIQTGQMRLELYADAHQPTDNGLNADAGAELRFMMGGANLDLRAGYKDLPLRNTYAHLTLGGGLDLQLGTLRFGADVAYVPFELLGHVTMLDLRLYF
ncbi:PorV/PorQ family protein [Rhodocaloribacter litoris]|uniref:PorV/PorQ family protein n=1 Tax=Rhodocaloribacter litoris TaxID=2558931 RepID=UPI00142041A9|nr:PorV/PorQ family protein [Rhodocaloribacter litoris]QXD14030.1 PorV/PorQ family protein [Rhodocaloribacter litoris]